MVTEENGLMLASRMVTDALIAEPTRGKMKVFKKNALVRKK